MTRPYQLNATTVLLFTFYYFKSHLALRKVCRQVLEITKAGNGNIRHY